KLSHEAGDLAEYAEVDPARLQSLLEQLGRSRIVRGVDGIPGSPARYEIFHDVLGPPILAWQHEHQLRSEREQAHRQRQRLRALVGAAVVALLVVGAAATYAFVQRSNAQTQASHALGRELAARALANLETNPHVSVELALRAAELAPGAQTASALRSSLLAMREERIFRLGGDIVAASFGPSDGGLLLASSNGRLNTYLDGRLYRVLPRGPALTTAVWSSDGQRFAAGAENGTVRIFGQGVPTGAAIHTPSSITALGFEQDTLLIAGGADVRIANNAAGGVKTFRFHGLVEAAALA